MWIQLCLEINETTLWFRPEEGVPECYKSGPYYSQVSAARARCVRKVWPISQRDRDECQAACGGHLITHILQNMCQILVRFISRTEPRLKLILLRSASTAKRCHICGSGNRRKTLYSRLFATGKTPNDTVSWWRNNQIAHKSFDLGIGPGVDLAEHVPWKFKSRPIFLCSCLRITYLLQWLIVVGP